MNAGADETFNFQVRYCRHHCVERTLLYLKKTKQKNPPKKTKQKTVQSTFRAVAVTVVSGNAQGSVTHSQGLS